MFGFVRPATRSNEGLTSSAVTSPALVEGCPPSANVNSPSADARTSRRAGWRAPTSRACTQQSLVDPGGGLLLARARGERGVEGEDVAPDPEPECRLAGRRAARPQRSSRQAPRPLVAGGVSPSVAGGGGAASGDLIAPTRRECSRQRRQTSRARTRAGGTRADRCDATCSHRSGSRSAAHPDSAPPPSPSHPLASGT